MCCTQIKATLISTWYKITVRTEISAIVKEEPHQSVLGIDHCEN